MVERPPNDSIRAALARAAGLRVDETSALTPAQLVKSFSGPGAS